MGGGARHSEPADRAIKMELRDAEEFVQREFRVHQIAWVRQPACPCDAAVRIDRLRRDAKMREVKQRATHLIRRRDENYSIVMPGA